VFLDCSPVVLGFSTIKRCSRCGEIKPLTEYSPDKSCMFGVKSTCRACNAEYTRKRMEAFRNSPKVVVASQICSVCKEELPATAEYFHKHNGRENGLQDTCKKCKAAYSKTAERVEYRKRFCNRDEYRENRRKKYHDDPRVKQTKRRNDQRPEVRAKMRAYQKTERGTLAFRAAAHRRKALKAGLPNAFSAGDWKRSLDHFGGCCAVCGRPPGLWHTIAADHWIPLINPDCPGTVPWNIVPLCHGVGGCNNSKQDKRAEDWLVATFGKRKGRAILNRINSYLRAVK
jgi:hypothetical protein